MHRVAAYVSITGHLLSKRPPQENDSWAWLWHDSSSALIPGPAAPTDGVTTAQVQQAFTAIYRLTSSGCWWPRQNTQQLSQYYLKPCCTVMRDLTDAVLWANRFCLCLNCYVPLMKFTEHFRYLTLMFVDCLYWWLALTCFCYFVCTTFDWLPCAEGDAPSSHCSFNTDKWSTSRPNLWLHYDSMLT